MRPTTTEPAGTDRSDTPAPRVVVPPITYPDLPVAARRDDIAAAIRDHQVVVLDRRSDVVAAGGDREVRVGDRRDLHPAGRVGRLVVGRRVRGGRAHAGAEPSRAGSSRSRQKCSPGIVDPLLRRPSERCQSRTGTTGHERETP